MQVLNTHQMMLNKYNKLHKIILLNTKLCEINENEQHGRDFKRSYFSTLSNFFGESAFFCTA